MLNSWTNSNLWKVKRSYCACSIFADRHNFAENDTQTIWQISDSISVLLKGEQAEFRDINTKVLKLKHWNLHFNFDSGGVLGFWGGVGSMGALFLLTLGSQRYTSIISSCQLVKRCSYLFLLFQKGLSYNSVHWIGHSTWLVVSIITSCQFVKRSQKVMASSQLYLYKLKKIFSKSWVETNNFCINFRQ